MISERDTGLSFHLNILYAFPPISSSFTIEVETITWFIGLFLSFSIVSPICLYSGLYFIIFNAATKLIANVR